MPETPPAPASANMAPQDPEAVLRGQLNGLVTDVIAHYEALPSKTQSATNPWVPERTVVMHRYRDGSERHVVADPSQGVTETNLHLSGAVVDQHGRRVVLVDKQYADGSVQRDVRFLPSQRRVETVYRWNDSQPPVYEMFGQAGRRLVAGTPQFAEATQLTGQVATHWETLREHQRASGSIQAAKAGAGMLGLLPRLLTGRRSSH